MSSYDDKGPVAPTRVLVTGASGTLGAPTVRVLAERGHKVVGLTRSPDRAAQMRRDGIEAVTADLLDRDELTAALAAVRPQAVLALLSARPREGLTRSREFEKSIALWSRGCQNLLRAAAAAGVSRVVAESTIFAYGYGDLGPEALDEHRPAEGGEVLRAQRRSLGALRAMETSVRHAQVSHGLEGIVVRSGVLYGRGVPSTDFISSELARGKLRLPAGGASLLSWLESTDAAHGRALTLERGRGGEIYNLADDQPATFGEFASALARELGTPPPRPIALTVARLLRPHAAVFIGATRLLASNRRAARDLGWRPRYRSVHAGIRRYAEQRIT